MNTSTLRKAPDLSKATKEVFGTPSQIDPQSSLYQAFANVITFINQWQSDFSKLSDNDKDRFNRIISGSSVTGKPDDFKSLESALMHMSFSKKGYNKLVDIVVEDGSDNAHDALERLQEVYTSEIELLNQTSYEFKVSSQASTQGRRPAGRTLRA